MKTIAELEKILKDEDLSEFTETITKYLAKLNENVEEEVTLLQIAAALLKGSAKEDWRKERVSFSAKPGVKYQRFFINVGEKDRASKNDIMELIMSKVEGLAKDDFADVYTLEVFSFFEAPLDFAQAIVDGVNGVSFKDREVHVELSEKKDRKPGGSRGGFGGGDRGRGGFGGGDRGRSFGGGDRGRGGFGGDRPRTYGGDRGGDRGGFSGGDRPRTYGGDRERRPEGDSRPSGEGRGGFGGDRPRSFGGDRPRSFGGDRPRSFGGDRERRPEGDGGERSFAPRSYDRPRPSYRDDAQGGREGSFDRKPRPSFERNSDQKPRESYFNSSYEKSDESPKDRFLKQNKK